MTSLRSKILTTYGFSKVVLLVFAAVVFADLHYLQSRILAGEAVNAFRETVQEMRREEKNLFLYHELANHDQLLAQIDAAEAALKHGQPALSSIASAAELARIEPLLRQYRAQLEPYPYLAPAARAAQQQAIRASGRALSELAETFSQRERAVLAQAVRVTGWILLAAILTVVLLGIAGALFLVSQVVRPLRALELQLAGLPQGRAHQLIAPSRDREIESFSRAFNTMLKRLDAQQNQLRHHEKAAALGVLVSGVAHELNNPLSNISTSVQLLQEDGDAEPALRQQWLAQIDGESERARRIVRRLLDSVRQPRLHMQTHGVADLVQSSLALVQRQLPPTLRVCVDVPADLTLQADRERLHQVFINLVKNAADAGAQHISVRARQTTWDASMPAHTDHLLGDPAPLAEAAAVLLLHIEDDGPGIPEADLDRIFDPFFTTRAAGDGTGLGLYLVEEIISEHHGCIAADNRSEGGTRFSLWLPLTQETA